MRFSTFIIFILGVVNLQGDLSHGRMSIIPEYDQNNVTILFSGHRAENTQKTAFLFTVPLDVDSVSLIKSNSDGELDFIIIPTRLIKDLKWVEVAPDLNEFAFMINSTKFLKPGNRHFEYYLSFSEMIGEFNFEITDVQKRLGDLFVHYGKVVSGSVKLNDNVEMKIDVERRDNIRAYHSATHLLHESLRRVLGTHVIQKGSLVETNRLRFDFSHIKPVSPEEINKIETFVNSMVDKKSEVKTRIMTPKEAVDNGALALFGEKYGDEVRVLSMCSEADKYFSTELCGGTHVRNTEDIGRFKIVSQSSIAAGVRRVEALREKQLQEFLNKKEKLSDLSSQKNEEIIKDLSKKIIKLGSKPNLENDNQQSLIKDLTKQFDQLSVKSILSDKSKNIIKDETINKIKVRFQKVIDLPPKDLRKLVDIGKKELGEGIVIVFASKDGKIGLAVGVTNKLTSKYDAVKFVKTGSEIVGGKGGGGRADFAQAGGVEINKIDQAFEKLKSLI